MWLDKEDVNKAGKFTWDPDKYVVGHDPYPEQESELSPDLTVKFKKLHPDAQLPSYANPDDAGMDLIATSCVSNDQYYYWEYGTGLAVEIPKGFVGLIFPRSSVSHKNQYLANAVGVIDSGYRGEIKLRFKMDVSPSKKQQRYQIGDKIGQLIIMLYPIIMPTWAEELGETSRGNEGFGSTGA